MKIWRCANPPEDSETGLLWRDDQAFCEMARERYKTGRFRNASFAALHEKCGPMRLVSVDALVIEKVEEGSVTIESIGTELKRFGELLRCTVCGREEPLGDVGANLAEGWSKCHGYTMTWLTARQLAESSQVGEPGP